MAVKSLKKLESRIRQKKGNEEKSKLYYSFGWGTSEKSLKGVPWPFVHIEEFEQKDD